MSQSESGPIGPIHYLVASHTTLNPPHHLPSVLLRNHLDEHLRRTVGVICTCARHGHPSVPASRSRTPASRDQNVLRLGHCNGVEVQRKSVLVSNPCVSRVAIADGVPRVCAVYLVYSVLLHLPTHGTADELPLRQRLSLADEPRPNGEDTLPARRRTLGGKRFSGHDTERKSKSERPNGDKVVQVQVRLARKGQVLVQQAVFDHGWVVFGCHDDEVGGKGVWWVRVLGITGHGEGGGGEGVYCVRVGG